MSYSIPEELNYNMLSRMYPSTKMELRKQPFNGSVFNPGSMILLDIPKMERSFLNPATLALNYNLRVRVVTGGTAVDAANHGLWLNGNAWAPFQRYVSKQKGGTDIDQIDWPGRLANTIMNMTTSADEKRSMISFGFNETNGFTNFGDRLEIQSQAINLTTEYNFTYSIPLIGALNASKFIPLNTADLELNLTLVSTVAEAIFQILPAGMTPELAINNVELVGEILTMEETGFNQLISMYPGVFNIKSQSYSYAAGTPLQADFAGGTIDQTVPFSLNSLKQFIWWVSPANGWNGNYGGVNPNLTNWQLIIGATPYPQQPVKCSSVAECYYQNSKAFGSFYSTGHSGSANRQMFGVASTASTINNDFAPYRSITGTAPTIANVETTNPNKFYQALDLEVINQLKTSLYSGISTRGSTNTLRMVIGRQLASTPHNIHMYACYDCVLNFDYVNGKITYSN